jgi:hypothetical protein
MQMGRSHINHTLQAMPVQGKELGITSQASGFRSQE